MPPTPTSIHAGKGFGVKPEHVKDFLACCEEQDRVYREAEASSHAPV